MNKIFLVVFLLFLNAQASAGVSLWGIKADQWNINNKLEKSMYIQGLFDAFVFSEYTVHGTKLNLDISVEQYSNAIDKLYSNYRNSHIPIPFLLRIVTLVAIGEENETIQMELQSYRDMFTDKNS